jgi:BirA family biotin operon repressor/biotin-[acetyl-CoA-carboxylase] ligase
MTAMPQPPPDAAGPPWLIALPTCASTSSWALARIEALAHGACVWTERQTAGRGQNGKTWHSPPGVLTASVVLDLPASVAPAQLALCAGLAVAHAVEDLAPAARVALKWPNDCMLDGRKLAGVLCERPARARSQPTRAAVVVGIGLNLDPQWDQQPAALPLVAERAQAPASVAEVQPAPDMATMLATVRRYLLEASGLLAVGGWSQLLPRLRVRDWLKGRWLELQSADGRLSGIAEGLDANGCLLLRGDDQQLRTISSGSVLRSAEIAGADGEPRRGARGIV